jgi:pyruvate formate lyase activating enzyme
VETFGALDGPGIRYVIFLQGCPLRCLYCHNPDSWDTHSIGNSATLIKTVEEIMNDIRRYRKFTASGGVTLSGGEPLYQHEFCRELLLRCRTEGLHTAIDTSGIIPLSLCRGAIDLASMVILDIKAISPALCIRLTGADNKNAIALLNYCESAQKPVWIRHVLLPGYTLEPAELERLAGFLTPYKTVSRVELLPFHKLGEYKWKELGQEYLLESTPEPDPEQVSQAREIFRKAGLPLA